MNPEHAPTVWDVQFQVPNIMAEPPLHIHVALAVSIIALVQSALASAAFNLLTVYECNYRRFIFRHGGLSKTSFNKCSFNN